MVTTTPDTLSPPDRGIRWFLQNQTSWSRAVLGSGVAILFFYIIGAIAVLTSHGWTGICPEGVTRLECSPSDPFAEGLKSDGLGLVARIAVGVADTHADDFQPLAARTCCGFVELVEQVWRQFLPALCWS